MMKLLLSIIAIASAPALACQTSDVEAYFKQYTSASGVHSLCRSHGGQVTAIFAGKVRELVSHPSISEATYAVQCSDGAILVGSLDLDSGTCIARTSHTEIADTVFP